MQIIERDILASTRSEYWDAISAVMRLYERYETPFILLVHYRVSRDVSIADRIRGARAVWRVVSKQPGTRYIVVSTDKHRYTLRFAQWIANSFKTNIKAYVYPTRAAAHAQAQILSREGAKR